MPGRARHGTRTPGRAPLKFSGTFGVFLYDRPSSIERWPESKLDGLAVGIRRDVEDWARVLHNDGTPSQAQNATVGLFLGAHLKLANQLWLEIIQLALDLPAWMPMLALTGQARRWELKKIRLRLFSAAARLVTTGRRRILRLARHWPWTYLITKASTRLRTLPNPG